MQPATPRIPDDKLRELVREYNALDETGKKTFLDAVAVELRREYGTDKALLAVIEHLAGPRLS